jgi:hypothetical protein
MSGTSKRAPTGRSRTSREFSDARAVLVLDDGRSRPATESDERVDPVAGERPLVVVGFTRGDWERAAECVERERDVYFVDATPSGTTRAIPDRLTVESVASPTDLTGIGIALEECCERVTPADGSPVCWIPSLTALLQYLDAQRGYRFCNAVVNRLAGADGSSQFEIQPGAHDEQTVATFESLADVVVDQSAEGTTVRRRQRV